MCVECVDDSTKGTKKRRGLNRIQNVNAYILSIMYYNIYGFKWKNQRVCVCVMSLYGTVFITIIIIELMVHSHIIVIMHFVDIAKWICIVPVFYVNGI